jgi:AraC-like DNA-binding protein
VYSTKGLNNTEEIFGLTAVGDYYFLDNNDFTTALGFYIKARQLSIETKNEYFIRATTSALASIKFLGGEFSEALALYHQYAQLGPYDRLGLYFNIANCHYELKNIDSLSYYTIIGIRESLLKKDTIHYKSFLKLNGVSQYMRGNYKRALDSLEKSRSLNMDTIDLSSSYYYTALTQEAMGNYDSTMYYFKEISALDQEPEIYFPEIKNVYYRLYENAKKNNQSDDQLDYIEKFMEVDSILISKSKGLISKIDKDYNLPLFEERRNQLRAAQATRKNLTYAIIALTALFITTVIFFLNRFIQQTKRLKEAIGNPEKYLRNVDSPKPVVGLNRNTLPVELMEHLDRFFNKFEVDEKFLDPTISLQQLSSAADTNNSYLSYYLNTHKGGYSNYINSLRAQYAFSDIPQNPKILIFTLDHIAKLYGFTSLRAFNRAFEKFLKIKPRDYLVQIRQRKQPGN